jgi:Uma2 family endonuclease
MTAEEVCALPEDGIDRELIRGELREQPASPRNPRHSVSEAKIAHLLRLWLDAQPLTQRRVLSGEAAFRLRRDPDTLVGIDVAISSAELMAAADAKASFLDGPPILAVEVLSPSDTHERIVEKVDLYLEVGTLVWVVDPDFRTVSVHRPGREVEVFNVTHELSGEPELPGLRIKVAELFG